MSQKYHSTSIVVSDDDVYTEKSNSQSDDPSKKNMQEELDASSSTGHWPQEAFWDDNDVSVQYDEDVFGLGTAMR